MVENSDHAQLVGVLKMIVPEFISNASRYEKLDKTGESGKLNGSSKNGTPKNGAAKTEHFPTI